MGTSPEVVRSYMASKVSALAREIVQMGFLTADQSTGSEDTVIEHSYGEGRELKRSWAVPRPLRIPRVSLSKTKKEVPLRF